jgi:hypothetical protein
MAFAPVQVGGAICRLHTNEFPFEIDSRYFDTSLSYAEAITLCTLAANKHRIRSDGGFGRPCDLVRIARQTKVLVLLTSLGDKDYWSDEEYNETEDWENGACAYVAGEALGKPVQIAAIL